VCGPNCNGIVSPHAPRRCGATRCSRPSPAAWRWISQSGNVAVNALAARRGLRFHTVIASGNQAVLSAADYSSTSLSRTRSGRSRCNLEDDGGPGVCDGLAACAEASVPVVILKVGRSAAGGPRGPPPTAAPWPAISVSSAGLVEERGRCGRATSTKLLELAKAWPSGDHERIDAGSERGGAWR